MSDSPGDEPDYQERSRLEINLCIDLGGYKHAHQCLIQ